jgi:GntR family transcriptional regulator
VDFYVTPGDELPLYRQLTRQIADAVAGGLLKPGDKLPSHRDLAAELVIAPLTVKKAYDELEQTGLIETKRGRGTFVRQRRPTRDQSDESRRRLRETAKRLLSQASLCGVSVKEIQHLIGDLAKGTRS